MSVKLNIYGGEIFNRWTCIKEVEPIKYGRKYFRVILCKCKCGNEKNVMLMNLTSGKSNGCGCTMSESMRERMTIPIYEGEKYNKLTVIKEVEKANDKRKSRQFLFKCDCGKEKVISLNDVRNGNTKSCGCHLMNIISNNKYGFKHGFEGTLTYNSYMSMLLRCNDTKHEHYYNYGGRGITVCKEWAEENGILNFVRDMGKRPSKEYTLDRKDGNGNYEPSNCRWATKLQQAANMRSNKFIEYNGVSFHQAEWERRLGIKRGRLWSLISKGRTPVEAIDYINATAKK